jgi:hypothetical protein
MVSYNAVIIKLNSFKKLNIKTSIYNHISFEYYLLYYDQDQISITIRSLKLKEKTHSSNPKRTNRITIFNLRIFPKSKPDAIKFTPKLKKLLRVTNEISEGSLNIEPEYSKLKSANKSHNICLLILDL